MVIKNNPRTTKPRIKHGGLPHTDFIYRDKKGRFIKTVHKPKVRVPQ